ncbi:WxL domain-containing protein [Enterococcus casseliflavus]|uniref:WxL domain-containing protein n=1 Tax=Enterococcus casseliflavus TaxID=37734 RepID=UPI0023DA354E|nr:WxL domain-containing protein [Enterococcus casseliflavus]WEL46772.1 WxL domain-containing protein [Enterococcus casseliflavus]
MKFIRLASIAVLSTTILAGSATKAFSQEVRDVTSNGQVEFRPAGEEDGELEVVNPEPNPDVEIEPEIPGTTGELSIMKVATMNFGTQVISNQDREYNMVAEMQQKSGTTGDDNKVPYVSFAQVHDLRGTNAGWDLEVSLSNFESQTQNNILTGAWIEFVGSQIRYEGSNSLNSPSAHEDNLELLTNGAAHSVMRALKGQGAGVSSVVWGNQEELTDQFASEDFDPKNDVVENGAIKLHVPGSTAKDATTYKATLLWDLTTTPDGDVGDGENNM